MTSNEEMLHAIKSIGFQKFIELVDIEKIEDHTVKIICRTIQTSFEELENVLVDRIHEQAKASIQ